MKNGSVRIGYIEAIYPREEARISKALEDGFRLGCEIIVIQKVISISEALIKIPGTPIAFCEAHFRSIDDVRVALEKGFLDGGNDAVKIPVQDAFRAIAILRKVFPSDVIERL